MNNIKLLLSVLEADMLVDSVSCEDLPSALQVTQLPYLSSLKECSSRLHQFPFVKVLILFVWVELS